jgi:hypothetical protein
MDPLDAIAYLAQLESKRFKFCKDEADVYPSLPYIRIYKNAFGKLEATGHNHKGHDNEGRMQFMTKYLNAYVLPNISKHIDPSGFYSIELHDSYSYLTNSKCYDNCLTFSRSIKDNQGILMPDMYHLCNYGGILSLKDPFPWLNKKDKIGFFGTTTGDREPLKNERIKACLWGLDNRDISDIYITNIAQMKKESIYAAIPNASMIMHPHVPEVDQYRYKFLLNIRGNTCCWNRLPMILNSKSVCFNMPCDDISFYYPLLIPKTHYVPVTYDNLSTMTHYYKNNPQEAQSIASNANHFVDQYLRGNQALVYMVHLFEGMAEQKP